MYRMIVYQNIVNIKEYNVAHLEMWKGKVVIVCTQIEQEHTITVSIVERFFIYIGRPVDRALPLPSKRMRNRAMLIVT